MRPRNRGATRGGTSRPTRRAPHAIRGAVRDRLCEGQVHEEPGSGTCFLPESLGRTAESCNIRVRSNGARPRAPRPASAHSDRTRHELCDPRPPADLQHRPATSRWSSARHSRDITASLSFVPRTTSVGCSDSTGERRRTDSLSRRGSVSGTVLPGVSWGARRGPPAASRVPAARPPPRSPSGRAPPGKAP